VPGLRFACDDFLWCWLGWSSLVAFQVLWKGKCIRPWLAHAAGNAYIHHKSEERKTAEMNNQDMNTEEWTQKKWKPRKSETGEMQTAEINTAEMNRAETHTA
jgi:hypothetical protein